MKIKKEVWIRQCDFCKEEATKICDICGKDVCPKHALELSHHYIAVSGNFVLNYPALVHTFCPDHLTPELLEILNKKLSEKH